jgi:hypothetical protein
MEQYKHPINAEKAMNLREKIINRLFDVYTARGNMPPKDIVLIDAEYILNYIFYGKDYLSILSSKDKS